MKLCVVSFGTLPPIRAHISRFHVFKAVKIHVQAFWLLRHGEDGGSKVLRKVGILPQDYTVFENEGESSEKLVSYRKTTRCLKMEVGILPQHYMVFED
jgi:hypothetical protein